MFCKLSALQEAKPAVMLLMHASINLRWVDCRLTVLVHEFASLPTPFYRVLMWAEWVLVAVLMSYARVQGQVRPRIPVWSASAKQSSQTTEQNLWEPVWLPIVWENIEGRQIESHAGRLPSLRD